MLNRSGKYLIITRIIHMSIELHKMYNTKILTKSELNLHKYKELLNIDRELKVRLQYT